MLAFCNFNFIMRHFLFLRTMIGQGFFNLFCASMFLVGNYEEVEIYGYVMAGLMGGVGLLYILIGCSCVKMHQDEKVAGDAGAAAAKTDDQSALLNTKDNEA